MNLIIISCEEIFDTESAIVNHLFENGACEFHLRKPQAAKAELQALLSTIDTAWHRHIVLHDHFELAESFSLKGIHLSRRNSTSRQGLRVVSRACHTIDELNTAGDDGNVELLLSPVFDSISKAGYHHAFTSEELMEARQAGLLTQQVVALGGISPDRIQTAATLGFGGVAVCGWLWGVGTPSAADEAAIIERFLQIKQITKAI